MLSRIQPALAAILTSACAHYQDHVFPFTRPGRSQPTRTRSRFTIRLRVGPLLCTLLPGLNGAIGKVKRIRLMEARRNEDSQCHAEYWASLTSTIVGYIQRVPILFLSALLASSTTLVSPVAAQQERQNQQEEASPADVIAPSESGTADED